MDNVNLNDMMDGTPRRSTTIIDLTNGDGGNVSSESTNGAKAIPVSSGPIDKDTIVPLDVNSILPKREPTPNPMENSMMAELDAAIDRECASISDRMDAIIQAQNEEIEKEEAEKENAAQEAQDAFAITGSTSTDAEDDTFGLYDDDISMDVADNDVDSRATRFSPIMNNDNKTSADNDTSYESTNTPNEVVVNTNNNDNKIDANTVNILDNFNDDDLFEPDDETSDTNSSNEQSTDELLKDLKGQIKDKISPIRKKFDLSKFTITQKSISAQKVMKLAVKTHQNVADWVMYSANRSISMTGLSGPEILKLNPENSNRNRLNTFRDMYRVIYDHVFDGNKPEFETWLKQVRFADLQHIYFALYMATFGGSNFINYSCPKCNKLFIKDVRFEDMVEYADDETRSKVKAMLKMDTTSPSNDSYEAELIQVSDTYVFAIKSPSIWNVIIETASLSDQFLEKHSDLIDMVTYIDAIYIIDADNNSLIPVDTKPDHNDQAKTSARRIKAFYDIISTLNSEDYYGLRAAINECEEDASKVTYKIPACTCPECSAEIKDNTDITPDSMLFTRHQLAAIGNM